MYCFKNTLLEVNQNHCCKINEDLQVLLKLKWSPCTEVLTFLGLPDISRTAKLLRSFGIMIFSYLAALVLVTSCSSNLCEFAG